MVRFVRKGIAVMVNEITKDIIGWDMVNWSQALQYWDKFIPQGKSFNLRALELGSGFNGGLSLWLGLKEIRTTCSGYHPKRVGISSETKTVHKRYGIEDIIHYEEINALDIPYKSRFDIVCYKSMLGGIARNDQLVLAKKVTNTIYESLKPGGVLFLAENLSSTVMHRTARNLFGSGKSNWRYFTTDELIKIHDRFNSFEYQTYGFLGCFGLNEKQKSILGKIDQVVFTKIVPEKWNYILGRN